MPDSITNIYLDTWLLRGLVSENVAERTEANHHMSKLRAHVFQVSIPQIALGETVAIIMRDFRSDPTVAYTKLKKLYDDVIQILEFFLCTLMQVALPQKTSFSKSIVLINLKSFPSKEYTFTS